VGKGLVIECNNLIFSGFFKDYLAHCTLAFTHSPATHQPTNNHQQPPTTTNNHQQPTNNQPTTNQQPTNNQPNSHPTTTSQPN
jgi:hypothetical protein